MNKSNSLAEVVAKICAGHLQPLLRKGKIRGAQITAPAAHRDVLGLEVDGFPTLYSEKFEPAVDDPRIGFVIEHLDGTYSATVAVLRREEPKTRPANWSRKKGKSKIKVYFEDVRPFNTPEES